jgi:hypothetical protein
MSNLLCVGLILGFPSIPSFLNHTDHRLPAGMHMDVLNTDELGPAVSEAAESLDLDRKGARQPGDGSSLGSYISVDAVTAAKSRED